MAKILNIEEIKTALTDIFETSANQGEALMKIYGLFVPDWDNVKDLKGWPIVGKELDEFICRLFMAFDANYHPEVLPGGAWLNKGFSNSSELEPWEVDLGDCVIVRKDKAEAGK